MIKVLIFAARDENNSACNNWKVFIHRAISSSNGEIENVDHLFVDHLVHVLYTWYVLHVYIYECA